MQSRAWNSLFSFNAHNIDLTGEVHGLLLGKQLHGNGQCVYARCSVCLRVCKCECSSESILASGGRRAQWFCSADGRVQTVRNRPDVFLMAPLLSGNRCTRLRAVKLKPLFRIPNPANATMLFLVSAWLHLPDLQGKLSIWLRFISKEIIILLHFAFSFFIYINLKSDRL